MRTLLSVSFLVPTLLCSSLFLSSCGTKRDDGTQRQTRSSTSMTVRGVVATPSGLDNIVRSSGTVLASEAVDLAPEAAGRVMTIAFKEGGRVSKGQVLLKINDEDLQAQLRKTELQIQLADDQEKRHRYLYEKSSISKEQYETTLNQLNQLRADRDNLQAAIRKREVRAPFDGIVGLRYVSEGGYVTQTTRIASVQKINPLKVDFAIPERYANQVNVGDHVTLSIEATGLKFIGRLYAIEPKIDQQLGTLQLRAVFDNKNETVFPGAFVNIELQLKRIPDALMVPTQAIIPVLKGQTLLVVKQGKVQTVPVQIGVRTATSVQITSGLAPGDTVVTTGLMQLRPGMPVNVDTRNQ
jgi:membrane fusion protein, multidrug efflux system